MTSKWVNYIFLGISVVLTIMVGFGIYDRFFSICIILGCIQIVLVNTLKPIGMVPEENWHAWRQDMKTKSISFGKGILYLHAHGIFPALLVIYTIILIIEKVHLFPDGWQAFMRMYSERFYLLWIVIGSAVLSNFEGGEKDRYRIIRETPRKNKFFIFLVCLLSFLGMWTVFDSIKGIGNMAAIVALACGIIIAVAGYMLLSVEQSQ